jgi:hypothetical protein
VLSAQLFAREDKLLRLHCPNSHGQNIQDISRHILKQIMSVSFSQNLRLAFPQLFPRPAELHARPRDSRRAAQHIMMQGKADLVSKLLRLRRLGRLGPTRRRTRPGPAGLQRSRGPLGKCGAKPYCAGSWRRPAAARIMVLAEFRVEARPGPAHTPCVASHRLGSRP